MKKKYIITALVVIVIALAAVLTAPVREITQIIQGKNYEVNFLTEHTEKITDLLFDSFGKTGSPPQNIKTALTLETNFNDKAMVDIGAGVFDLDGEGDRERLSVIGKSNLNLTSVYSLHNAIKTQLNWNTANAEIFSANITADLKNKEMFVESKYLPDKIISFPLRLILGYSDYDLEPPPRKFRSICRPLL
jgi:hypothetical protein